MTPMTRCSGSFLETAMWGSFWNGCLAEVTRDEDVAAEGRARLAEGDRRTGTGGLGPVRAGVEALADVERGRLAAVRTEEAGDAVLRAEAGAAGDVRRDRLEQVDGAGAIERDDVRVEATFDLLLGSGRGHRGHQQQGGHADGGRH